MFLKVFTISLFLTLLSLSFYGLSFSNNLSYAVSGSSMSPTVSDGSLVLVKSDSAYLQGDTIVYENGNSLVFHRVMDVLTIGENTYFSTKGDGNQLVDPDLVSFRQVIGKSVFSVPLLGSLFLTFKESGSYLLISTLVLLFVPTSLVFVRVFEKRDYRRSVWNKWAV